MNICTFSSLLFIFLSLFNNLTLAETSNEENEKRRNNDLRYVTSNIKPPSHMADNFDGFFDSCTLHFAPTQGVDLGWACLGVTTISPVLSVITSSLITTDSSVNSVYNPINAAKDDAQAYVATDGKEYHTAKLERAFRYVKKQFPKFHLNDMEVAHIIVDYNARQQH